VLEDGNGVNLKPDMDAKIEQIERYTSMPWSCNIPGCDQMSLELHCDALIN